MSDSAINAERINQLRVDVALLRDADAVNRRHIQKIREEFVHKEDFSESLTDAELRIRELEKFKAQLFGMFVAAHVLGGFIATLIGYIFSKK